jgi:hypothetical protein
LEQVLPSPEGEKNTLEQVLPSPEGCENTLEQVLFSIKIFVLSYNYSLGLKDLDCISSYTSIDDIYKKYQQSFEGVEEFLCQEDAINPFVLDGLDGFIPEVLETIKDDGFVVNHNSRDSKDFLDQHKKKLVSFKELNEHLFDINQPKVYSNVVYINELGHLLNEMKEQNESFNQRFDQQNQALKEVLDSVK